MTAPERHRLACAKPVPGYGLPREFWTSFARSHWGQHGAVLEQPFVEPLASPAELFECLVAASDRYRAGDHSVQLEFCIGHAQLLADVGKFLPMRADGSSAAYAKRVTELLDGRRFGLVVEDLQAYDATLWLRLRDFLRGLYEHTGLPQDAAKATVFLGNYDRTPFGLHRGNSANFMFVVDGQKRMRTWPDAYFRGKPDLTHKLDYDAHNADAIVMDAAPGDVIFWPSDYWHIGESVDGGLSSAVSVALFMEPRPFADVIGRAASLIGRQAGKSSTATLHPDSLTAAVSTFDTYAQSGAAALDAVSADPALVRALRIGMMNKTTGYGFTRPPAALPHVSLTPDVTVHGVAGYPVLWAADENDDIICSANGHAFSVAASPRTIALLERINGGAVATVGALMADHSGIVEHNGIEFETTLDDVRTFLEKLFALRALVIREMAA